MQFSGGKAFASIVLGLAAAAVLSTGGRTAAQDLSTGPRLARRGEARGPVDVKQLAKDSTLIVRGRVVKGQPKMVGRTIYTFYDLAVRETVKGSTRQSVSVAILGGAIGNVQLDVPEAPTFQSGDELVFFGRPFADAPSAFRATGAFAGLVPILSSANKRDMVAPRGKLEGVEEFLKEVRALSNGQIQRK